MSDLEFLTLGAKTGIKTIKTGSNLIELFFLYDEARGWKLAKAEMFFSIILKKP